MTARTIVILVGTSLALVVAGGIVLRAGQRASITTNATTIRGPLLPALARDPGEAERIIVTRGGLRVVLERVGPGASRWVVASKHGYPADERAVRGVLTGAIDAVVVEEKTALASNFARLGVADQSDGDATAPPGTISTRLRIEGIAPPDGAKAERAVLGDVLIGRPEVAAPGAPRGPARVFVRRVGEPRALLAEGTLAAEPDWLAWVSTLISRLDEVTIDRVEVVRPGAEPLIIERSTESGALAISGMPEGRTLRDEMALARLASVVSTLTFEDVAPATTITMPQAETVIARFTRRDGLTMAVHTHRRAEEFWIKAEAAFSSKVADSTADAAGEAQVREMNERWSPWAFRIAPFRGEDLTRTLEDLLAPPPDPQTPGTLPAQPEIVQPSLVPGP